ncbi:AEC family transporter [Egicoccus sp. AB-alg2]|uniref:AEC family transporter n=1 Tax=Egicoccus sp. AB-alg2 TaxID=3242693 RepID=UPI00359D223C
MLTVLALLLVGVLLGHVRVLPRDAAATLEAFLVRVALPALILAVVPDLEVDARFLLPAAVAWAVVLGLSLLVWAGCRLADLDRRTTGTLLVVVPLGNTSFLGFPAVEALLGAAVLPFAVVYDQFGSFLALATLSTVVAARYGAATPPGPAVMVRRVLRFPPFVALVVSLLANGLGGLPPALGDVATTLGATVTPVAMIAVGMRLRLRGAGWRPAPLTAGLAARLVLAPAVVLLVARSVGLDDVWRVSVLESAMPPMVMGGVVAASAGLDDRLAAQLIAVGAVVAMATLPLWTLALG